MKSIENFNWGWMDKPVEIIENGEIHYLWRYNPDGTQQHMSEYHKQSLIKEIFEDRIYERFFEVEEGDVVLDIGASLGVFTHSILHKNPKHVYCIEPSESEFRILNKNLSGFPVTTIFKGISRSNSLENSNMLFGGENQMEGITFKKLVDLYGLEKINFLKTDCEGGEYLIFNEENLEKLKKIDKISGEWHLNTPEMKNLFREFRDNFLIHFEKYEIFSIDGVDIKWDLWSERFIEYYNEILIYIDNRTSDNGR